MKQNSTEKVENPNECANQKTFFFWVKQNKKDLLRWCNECNGRERQSERSAGGANQSEKFSAEMAANTKIRQTFECDTLETISFFFGSQLAGAAAYRPFV